MNFPRVHPRSAVVSDGQNRFSQFWLALCQELDLTAVEQLQILNQEQASLLKSCLRQERHPEDPSRPADFV